jgi:thiamine biosynthesis lipoprotein
MGMPITVEILDPDVTPAVLDEVFDYFRVIDEIFSTYKETSEISRINRGEIGPAGYSEAMRTIFELSEQTKRQTHGYFDIERDGRLNPSGIVKGWAVQQAIQRLKVAGRRDFYIDAGGDIQVNGTKEGRLWRVGIRNPFERREIVKVLAISDRGVATSGTAVRGQHIYNPFQPERALLDVVSLTVIGQDVYEADRFATAAFAMERAGITFIEALPGFEGYMIDADAHATYTSGFERYVLPA